MVTRMFLVPAVVVVHELMHQRTGKQQHVGHYTQEVRTMFDKQKKPAIAKNP